jgi:hypothetical protein
LLFSELAATFNAADAGTGMLKQPMNGIQIVAD